MSNWTRLTEQDLLAEEEDSEEVDGLAIYSDRAETDLDIIESYARRRNAKKRELEAVKANCEKIIASLTSDLEKYEARYTEPVKAALRNYLETNGTKKRSVDTPFGRVGLRAKASKIVVEGGVSEELEAFVRAHSDDPISVIYEVFTTTKKMNKRVFDDLVMGILETPDNGVELPDFIKIEPAGDNLYVE